MEKILSQEFSQPVLIAVSKILEKNKKQYYAQLEKCNHTLNIDDWISYFVDEIIKAQQSSGKLLSFILVKSKILFRACLGLNERQIKVLLRIFEEGVEGFKGGLSAENYISITKTSKAIATRDLVDLVEKKVLVKTGQLRYSRYFVNQHFE